MSTHASPLRADRAATLRRDKYRRPLDVLIGLLLGMVCMSAASRLADYTNGQQPGGLPRRRGGAVRGQMALEDLVAGAALAQQQQRQQRAVQGEQAAGGVQQYCPANWESLFFVHLPKSSGSFVKLIVKNGLETYGTGAGKPGSWCPVERQGELYNACQPPIPGDPRPYIDQEGLYPRMLAGIFPGYCNGLSLHKDFGIIGTVLGREELPRLLLMTVLREPVARVVSSYYFRAKICGPSRVEYRDCDYDFKDIEGEMIKHAQRHSNRMTKQLAGWSDCAWQAPGGGLSHTLACAHSAAAAGGGCRDAGRRQLSDAELLAAAKDNLARHCWIGVQERMEESLALLKAAMAPTWPGLNVTGWVATNTNSYPDAPEAARAEVARLNALDVELYKYGLELFERRLAEAGLKKAPVGGGAAG